VLLAVALVVLFANFTYYKKYADDLKQDSVHFKPFSLVNSALIKPDQDYTPNCLAKKFNFAYFLSISLNFSAGFLIGVALVVWQAQLLPQIEPSRFAAKQWATGQVDSLPKIERHERFTKLSFTFRLESLHGEVGNELEQIFSYRHPKVSVSWYLSETAFTNLKQVPRLGEKWRFFGRLKQNHGSMNPFSRDYEAWLYQKGISAKLNVSGDRKIELFTGEEVRNASRVERVSLFSAENLRQVVAQFFHLQLKESQNYAIYRALILGDKSQIQPEQWQLFQHTGTIHLMAISGLHMSIMAAIGFLLAKILWWLLVYRQMRVGLPVFSALISLAFASIYLLVSGGDIPTQRAWIMVATFIVFPTLKRKFQPFSAVAMAAFLIILWDFKAVLSSGFWLSFTAVLLIFSTLEVIRGANKWLVFLVVQWVLSLGLIPLVIWHYGEIPVYSIAANLIAVPFMTFIGLPLLLIVLLISLFSTTLAEQLIFLLDQSWRYLWHYLVWIAELPVSSLMIRIESVGWLAVFYTGLYLIFKVAKQSSFNSVWRLVLLTFVFTTLFLLIMKAIGQPSVPDVGEAKITVLDVGQGQSILIETANHTLVYDAGAKWGRKTDAAKVALLPYLRAQQIKQIDDLMISHSDIDHAGGTLSILETVSVKRQFSGQPDKVNQMLIGEIDNKSTRTLQTFPDFKQCIVGQQWVYDEVVFEVISPEQQDGLDKNLSDNDLSCVLKVSNSRAQIMIMGDVGQSKERQILANSNLSLSHFKSELLIAGHHGSRYSTSNSWLQAVQPKMVIFSSGYGNRFNFPNTDVLQRIKQVNADIDWWNTACSGAVIFYLDESGIKMVNESRKSQRKWYHHRCSVTQQGILYQ